MPRRVAALATPAASTPRTDGTVAQQQDDPFVAEVSLLRRHWKWAAFSQFFYTFATLFAMPDVTLADIEDDLTRSTSIVIHRVIHRLLVTATLDRKLSIDHWQTALRKQYKKRDPGLNPIGPEPVVQLPTPSPDSPEADDDEGPKDESVSTPGPSSVNFAGDVHMADGARDGDQERKPEPSVEPSEGMKTESVKNESTMADDALESKAEEESKNWLELPMLTKLDTLHLLTEWQFHNVSRLRTLMKDDDETAQWRIEPIGYDSKTNAYWLIGPDRLWIQRALPKPPRSLKRKRTPAKPKSKRAATPDDESDAPPTPKKRKSTASSRSTTIRIPAAAGPSTPVRPTRTRRGAPPSPEDLGPTLGRGSRAAKTQASAKLSAQAKELAELQRQAALEGRRSGRRAPSPSPPQRVSPRRPKGTRLSARLHGAVTDDEWQEVPDEWLNDAGEDTAGASESELPDEDGAGPSSEAGPDAQHEADADADTDADADMGRPKMGLEDDDDDDAVSELTALSEDSPPATVVRAPSRSKKASNKRASSGRRKTAARSKRKARAPVEEEPAPAEEPAVEAEPEEEVEPEWRPPDDFVEWETICVTLYEWEHICEQFEGATHYAEKALYKLLSQHIVPVITAELREIQRKRQLEEAVSQRKRSSRLAVKENEREEARQAAVRKAEEEEKLSRARRLEARQRREEDERMKREEAREKRRLDREEREKRKAEEEKVSESTPVDVVAEDTPPPTRKASATAKPGRPRAKVAPAHARSSASASGSRTPAGEDWVLDCEICHRTGVNKDDGQPLLCCGKCAKWQHIACHDLVDLRAGRPKRNWDAEEFICRTCRGEGPAPANGALPPPTPNGAAYRVPYHGYSGQVPYGAALAPQYTRAPAPYPPHAHAQHPAITFTHYQPQQRQFSTAHASQAYAQSPYGAAKPAAAYGLPQYSPYPNGTHWSGAAHAQSSAASWAPNGYSTPAAAAAGAYSSSAERSSVAGPYAAAAAGQNGSGASGSQQQAAAWRGSAYAAQGAAAAAGTGSAGYYPPSGSAQPRAP
ncbi:hypothetical protein BC834DRAFT_973901 [Gloeopeniophorella convolvens]|nr:hypothetical protein BC834DRAFT_973901 [Gloeopeniophorella convolvens]